MRRTGVVAIAVDHAAPAEIARQIPRCHAAKANHPGLEIAGVGVDVGAEFLRVTHELPSIMQVVDQCIMLDRAAGGIIARGAPRELADRSTDLRVQAFFRRQPMQRNP